MKKIAIIGAGVAGIAVAIRLKALGFQVDLFEKEPRAGGKLFQFSSLGARFDMGPSLFTMPELVNDLFILSEKNIHSYIEYEQIDPISRYYWDDKEQYFDAPSDQSSFIKNASDFFKEPVDSIRKYFQACREKFELTEDVFLKNSLHLFDTYWKKSTLESALKIYKLQSHRSLHALHHELFSSPHLIQLLDRYATYNGSSPFKAPATLSLIAHIEHSLGAYYPKGGMYKITEALFRLASDMQVQFHFNTEVLAIQKENKKISVIETTAGAYECDSIVCATDMEAFYKKILKEPLPFLQKKAEKSTSALIFFVLVEGNHPEMELHTIFYSKNYKEEFEQIFSKQSIPDDPSIYVYISSKRNPSDAPIGYENWFVMINVPAGVPLLTEEHKKVLLDTYMQTISKKIRKKINYSFDPNTVQEPMVLENRTGSIGGALYGNSSNSIFSAFLRHSNFSSRYNNLYFCGGSVHPGGGIPLCLLSASIVASRVQTTLK